MYNYDFTYCKLVVVDEPFLEDEPPTYIAAHFSLTLCSLW